MSLLDRRHAIRTPQQHAAFFHNRERRKAQAGSLTHSLFRTHSIRGASDLPAAIAANVFAAADHDRPVVFACRIRFTGIDASGVIFEHGNATEHGIGAWIATAVGGESVGLVAGSSTVANERAALSWDIGGTLASGHELDLAFVIEPGAGRIRLFNSGREMEQATSVAGDFGSPSDWTTGTEGGHFLQAVTGTNNPGMTVTTAPSNFIGLTPLSVFVGQLPRQLSGIQLGDQ